MTALSRRAAFRLGHRAETIAAWLLRCKGYKILARRYKTPAGEIDLVARRGRFVAFVEVKARPTLDAAIESIRHTQRSRIVRAGEMFLSRNPQYVNHFLRFDAILIAPGRLPRHLISAFDAS
jgi:putative endonuclease